MPADVRELEIVATVFLEGDEGEAIPVDDGSIVKFTLIVGSNTGALTEEEVETEGGIAITTLQPSTNPGDTYQVRAQLKKQVVGTNEKDFGDDGPSKDTEVIEVVPGRAFALEVTKSRPTYPADEKSEATISVTARDAFGNLVADGTGVSWRLEGLGDIPPETSESEILDGYGEAIVRSGCLAENQSITARVGPVEQAVTMSVQSIVVSLTSESDYLNIVASPEFPNAHKTVLTATFADQNGNPVPDGTEVTWFTSNGTFEEGFSGVGNVFETVVVGGTSSVVLNADGGRFGSALVRVSASNFGSTKRIQYVTTGPLAAKADRPFLALDANANGTIAIEQLDGTTRDVPFYASTPVQIFGTPNATVNVSLTGPAASKVEIVGSSQITLDSQGKGTVTVRSLGTSTPGNNPEAFNIVISDGVRTTQVPQRAGGKRWYSYVYNFALGFAWGDSEGIEGMAGDFTAGMLFGIGDIRDILKELGKLWPGGGEPNWVIFGFSLIGLITEFAPLVGEIPDAFITAAKVIIKRLKVGPLVRVLCRLVKQFCQVWARSGLSAAAIFAGRYALFLKAVVLHGSGISAIDKFNGILKSLPDVENVCALHKKVGDNLVNNLLFVANKADLGEEAAEKVIKSLMEPSALSDAVLTAIGTSADAMEGAGRVLKQMDPSALNKALGTTAPFTATYKQEHLLMDCNVLLKKNANIVHLGDAVIDAAKQNNYGKTFEIAAAARRSSASGETVDTIGIQALDAAGIDFTSTAATYQVKLKALTLMGKGRKKKPADEIAGVIEYLTAGKKASAGKPYKVIISEGDVPPAVATWMANEGIELITIPF